MKIKFPLYPRLMDREVRLRNQGPELSKRGPVLTHPYASSQEGYRILEAFRTAIDILNYRNPEKLSYDPADASFMQEAKHIALMGLAAKFKYIGARTKQKEAYKINSIYGAFLDDYPDPVELWGFKTHLGIAGSIKFEINETSTGLIYNVLDVFLPKKCGVSFIRPTLAKRDAIINFIYNFCTQFDIYDFGVWRARLLLFPLIQSLAQHNRFSHPLPAHVIHELLISSRTKLPFNIPSF
jgi:hypothetical protein